MNSENIWDPGSKLRIKKKNSLFHITDRAQQNSTKRPSLFVHFTGKAGNKQYQSIFPREFQGSNLEFGQHKRLFLNIIPN